MQDSLFAKIIRSEIPCHKIYEDELTVAFLDIHPIQSGHTLVVSKKQVAFVWDLPAADYEAVMRTAQKVAKRLKEVLAVAYVGEQIMGTDVPHAHVHLIPFNTKQEFYNRPDNDTEPDHEALARLAQKLHF